MARTCNEHLLGFRENKYLLDAIQRYDVVLGDTWYDHPVLRKDPEFCRHRFHGATNVGQCLEDLEVIWIADYMDRQETAITLIHEFLHDYVGEHDLDDLVTHDEIEEEAQLIARDRPDLVTYIASYYALPVLNYSPPQKPL